MVVTADLDLVVALVLAVSEAVGCVVEGVY